MLSDALSEGDEDELMAAVHHLKALSPSERRDILRSPSGNAESMVQLPGAELWGSRFTTAASNFACKTNVWEALACVSDLRPPPVNELLVHFGDPSLVMAVIAGLEAGEPHAARTAACRCCRNLARVTPLRTLFQPAIQPLVLMLADMQLSAPAAAALCNIACSPTGKNTAVAAGAVPLLLKSIHCEASPSAMDDMVACLGVVTSGFASEGAKAVAEFGTDALLPLLKALRFGHPVLASTTLQVVGDLALGLGPSSDIVSSLMADRQLATEDLPPLVCHQAAPIREASLKLVALLVQDANFKRRFLSDSGVAALEAAADLEPPADADSVTSLSQPRSNWQMMCAPGCADTSCFTGMPGLNPEKLATRREIAENLIAQANQDDGKYCKPCNAGVGEKSRKRPWSFGPKFGPKFT